MRAESPQASVQPGLVWGLSVLDGQPEPLEDIEAAKRPCRPAEFRWLHLNLADQPTRRWIANSHLPPRVRELLLSGDSQPQAIAEGDAAAFALPDIERDFDEGETRIGSIRFAVTPTLMLTARNHPLRSADIVRQRLAAGHAVADPVHAMDLLLSSMAEAAHRIIVDMERMVRTVEDDLMKGERQPDARTFIALRMLMVRTHRLLTWDRAVLHGLHHDQGFSPEVLRVATKASERMHALDSDLVSIQSQMQLLREELDLEATQRTNQNLYALSILTALLAPATLVTGFFGMNTGGLPWTMSKEGTGFGLLIAVGCSLAVYAWLRMKGFIRR